MLESSNDASDDKNSSQKSKVKMTIVTINKMEKNTMNIEMLLQDDAW